MRWRSSSNRSATALEIHLPQLEAAARPFDQHLHLRFGLVQLRGGGAEQLDAFFEQLERFVEPDLFVLQARHDLVETAETLFVCHAGNDRSPGYERKANKPFR